MNVAFFSAKPYDRQFFNVANEKHGHRITFLEPRLTADTVSLARGNEVVCAFVNDQLSSDVLEQLHTSGVRLIALRSAGYNHLDLHAAARLPLTAVHVPRYSPYS